MTGGPAGTADVNTALARTLVDEWVRGGLRDAALAPGSRSAPLALALAGHPRVRLHVHVDERSAAFFALGAAKASGRPVVVGCTSGTAAAHLHAAVLEARHGRVPLIVCTADRPPELRQTGAAQTVDQVGLYGGAVRFAFDCAPEDHPAAMAAWRPLAVRAYAEAAGPPAGPVHLNLAFREPLVPDPARPVPAVPGRSGGRPWTATAAGRLEPPGQMVERLAAAVVAAERGLLVAGWGTGCPPATVDRFARAAGWPVLADPLSGARRGRQAVSTYEALLRVPGFAGAHRPDLVIRLGATLTSKTATSWLDGSMPAVVVDPDGAWIDPARSAGERLAVDPGRLLDAVTEQLRAAPAPRRRRSAAWTAGWLRAERAARTAIDRHLDASDAPFEGRVARDLAAWLPSGATLVVASSMPVRDLEFFAAPRAGLGVLANRGVNGIDGFASTVLGVAAVASGPVAGLGGDLAFLHDAAGLTGAASRGLDATLVVVDNDGGGIFSFLPQASSIEPSRFDALFGTPHGLDLTAVARAYGLTATRLKRASDLVPALEKAAAGGGVQVVVVPTGDRPANVERHRQVWAAVAAALARPGGRRTVAL